MAGQPRAAGSRIQIVLAVLVGMLIGAVAMAAGSGYFVRSYLLSHPELIPEAMQRLQQRDAGRAAQQYRAVLEAPFHGGWAGAANGDVVLVEFFDYACGFCRKSNADLERLLREDPRLKIVWREYPVLGPASEQAALASLAAARAGRFRQFYDALFAAGRPSQATIAAARTAAGLGAVTPTEEMSAELQKNFQLGEAIGASGTPTFVVGDQVLQGAVGYEALKEAIARARSKA